MKTWIHWTEIGIFLATILGTVRMSIPPKYSDLLIPTGWRTFRTTKPNQKTTKKTGHWIGCQMKCLAIPLKDSEWYDKNNTNKKTFRVPPTTTLKCDLKSKLKGGELQHNKHSSYRPLFFLQTKTQQQQNNNKQPKKKHFLYIIGAASYAWDAKRNDMNQRNDAEIRSVCEMEKWYWRRKGKGCPLKRTAADFCFWECEFTLDLPCSVWRFLTDICGSVESCMKRKERSKRVVSFHLS